MVILKLKLRKRKALLQRWSEEEMLRERKKGKEILMQIKKELLM